MTDLSAIKTNLRAFFSIFQNFQKNNQIRFLSTWWNFLLHPHTKVSSMSTCLCLSSSLGAATRLPLLEECSDDCDKCRVPCDYSCRDGCAATIEYHSHQFGLRALCCLRKLTTIFTEVKLLKQLHPQSSSLTPRVTWITLYNPWPAAQCYRLQFMESKVENYFEVHQITPRRKTLIAQVHVVLASKLETAITTKVTLRWCQTIIYGVHR